VLVTRFARYDDGLAAIDRAVELRDHDAGLWYARGWLYEFAAHEMARRSSPNRDVRGLYERAAESFRACLSLRPEGKLAGDAEDLLDHVENELRS
jgi:hypothetical protein